MNDTGNEQWRAAGTVFWGLVFGTLLVLAMVYVALLIQGDRATHPAAEPVPTRTPVFEQLELVLPEVFSAMQPESATALRDIEAIVAQQIDAAFTPVYDRIPVFLDFHYSVLGEYTELLAAASSRIGSSLQRILLTESDFDRHLAEAVAQIGGAGDARLKQLLRRLSQTLQGRLGLSDGELAVLSQLAQLSFEDTLERFGTTELLLKGVSAATGAGAVGLAITKTLAPKVAAKLAAKVAGKAALKGVGVGGSVAGGAALGLLCGPAALICSTGGAIGAGVLAWLATDKAVVEADQFFNRAAFEQEIRGLLDAEQRRIKRLLTEQYKARLENVLADAEVNLKGLKTKDLPAELR